MLLLLQKIGMADRGLAAIFSTSSLLNLLNSSYSGDSLEYVISGKNKK